MIARTTRTVFTEPIVRRFVSHERFTIVRVFVGIFSIDRIRPEKEASDAVTTNRQDWV